MFLILILFCNCHNYGRNRTNEDFSKKYDKICIEGHVYYFFPGNGYGDSAVIKLDDNGKPVKCGCSQVMEEWKKIHEEIIK